MLDENPGLGAEELKARLMATAEDWGPAGVDPDYGAGRLDAYAALRGRRGAQRPAAPARARAALGDAHGYGRRRRVPAHRLEGRRSRRGNAPRAVRDVRSDLNLDLESLDPTGAEVAAAARVPGTTDPNTGTSISGRHEDLGFVPTLTGTYCSASARRRARPPSSSTSPPEQRTGRQRRACLHRRGRCRAVILTGSDPDGQPLTYGVTAQPAHGSLTGTPPS